MRVSTKFTQQLLIVIGLLALPACGGNMKKMLTGKGENSSDATKYGTPQAMIKAKGLALSAPQISTGLKNFGSCAELKADIEKSLEAQWIQDKANIAMQIQGSLEWEENPDKYYPESSKAEAAADNAPTASNAGTASTSAPTAPEADDGKTNVQEKGVDEADRVRVGLDQIFATSFDKLEVIDRASLKVVGTMPIDTKMETQIFTSGHKLVILEKVFKTAATSTAGSAKLSSPVPSCVDCGEPEFMGRDESVLITTYETKVGEMPKKIRSVEHKGSYVDSRLVGSQLILVLNDSIPTESAPIEWSEFSDEVWFKKPAALRIFNNMAYYARREKLSEIKGDKISDVACTSIMQRKVLDFDYSLAKTISLNIDDAAAESKAVGSIGQGDEIYVTADSIYLLKTKITWLQSNYYSSYEWSGSVDEKLFIRQIGLNATSGELAAVGEGQVQGHIKDRWALHATNAGKNLIVTTSTGNLFDHTGPNIALNHLFVLELNAATKTLDIRSKTPDFGKFEDIRAVRYIGDKVYVVTFKKTDPLFAFDLSNLSEPKILSGLKIPGFSTYMHPLADGRILGVGFDALEQGDFAYYQGIQVSLFDVSNPLEMARIDNHIYGDRGSNSEVTSNHRAFFFDETSKLIGLPLVELDGDQLKGERTVRAFSGALMLSFENDKLVEAGRISHADWIPQQCLENMNSVQWWSNPANSLDVNRIYKVDGRILTISQFGVKAYSTTDFVTPVVATQFAKPAKAPCQPIFVGWGD